jgi:Domain of unknown function (DU1801)
MPENKTQPTTQSVAQFLAAIPEDQRRQDCQTLVDLMRQVTGAEPTLWGSNIIGFGKYHYVYDSGREGDSMLTGFSPRKPALTLYVSLGGASEEREALLQKLGKYKAKGGCLYIKKLEDVHTPTLKKLIALGVKDAKKQDKPPKKRA